MRDRPHKSRLLVATEIAFAVAVAATVVVRALQHPLDHDEHQFVASGALIARDGLLPYRDFPYFHLPYLSYLYASVFLVSDRLLLAARGLSSIAALATVAVVASRAYGAFPTLATAAKSAIAMSVALVLVTNPIFRYAAGRAWNHDFAILLTLLATLRIATVARSGRPLAAALVGGALLGLACGVRSTMATLIPALALALWLVHRNDPQRSVPRLLAAYFLGGMIALLPVGMFFVLAPEQFLHGNLAYNLTLNPLYRLRLGHEVAMSFGEKLSYLRDYVLAPPRTVALVGAYAVTGLLALVSGDRTRRTGVATSVALCVPALLWAAFTPTPSWYQYYYAIQVFLLAGVIAHVSLTAGWGRALAVIAVLPMLAGGVTGLRWSWPFVPVRPAASWTVNAVHAIGDEAAALVGDGRVLTLGPIYALEGDVAIYPALVTGPFQWRTADLVPNDRHDRLGLLGPGDLLELKGDPELAGILTGVELDPAENLEGALLEMVTGENWAAHELGDGAGLVLWLPPRP